MKQGGTADSVSIRPWQKAVSVRDVFLTVSLPVSTAKQCGIMECTHARVYTYGVFNQVGYESCFETEYRSL